MWQVSEDEGIAAEQLLAIRAGAADPGGRGVRVAWHPASEDIVAFSTGNSVYVASVSTAGSQGAQVGAPQTLSQHFDMCSPVSRG